jgi:hypothetical protein
MEKNYFHFGKIFCHFGKYRHDVGFAKMVKIFFWVYDNYMSLQRSSFLLLLEHIFKKWALLKSLCRPSVCLSVRYFSAGIVPRELKF